MSCKIAKQVSQKCAGVVPKKISLPANGMSLNDRSHFYYFDGNTGDDWPTHDPCGSNAQNHLKNVGNPHGNIFVR